MTTNVQSIKPAPTQKKESNSANNNQNYVCKEEITSQDITSKEINVLVKKMRSLPGLEIEGHWSQFRYYPLSFFGKDAVSWLIENQNSTKKEAIAIGKLLVEKEIIYHVNNKFDFEDRLLLYRFYEDDIFANMIIV